MAISILKYPNIITPVYSTDEFILYDASKAGNSDLYYTATLTIVDSYNGTSGQIRNFEVFPDANGYASFNANSIIESFLKVI